MEFLWKFFSYLTDQGTEKLKKDARVLVFPNGGCTFPVLDSEN